MSLLARAARSTLGSFLATGCASGRITPSSWQTASGTSALSTTEISRLHLRRPLGAIQPTSVPTCKTPCCFVNGST
jgi:hypothetical protein